MPISIDAPPIGLEDINAAFGQAQTYYGNNRLRHSQLASYFWPSEKYFFNYHSQGATPEEAERGLYARTQREALEYAVGAHKVRRGDTWGSRFLTYRNDRDGRARDHSRQPLWRNWQAGGMTPMDDEWDTQVDEEAKKRLEYVDRITERIRTFIYKRLMDTDLHKTTLQVIREMVVFGTSAFQIIPDNLSWHNAGAAIRAWGG